MRVLHQRAAQGMGRTTALALLSFECQFAICQERNVVEDDDVQKPVSNWQRLFCRSSSCSSCKASFLWVLIDFAWITGSNIANVSGTKASNNNNCWAHQQQFSTATNECSSRTCLRSSDLSSESLCCNATSSSVTWHAAVCKPKWNVSDATKLLNNKLVLRFHNVWCLFHNGNSSSCLVVSEWSDVSTNCKRVSLPVDPDIFSSWCMHSPKKVMWTGKLGNPLFCRRFHEVAGLSSCF